MACIYQHTELTRLLSRYDADQLCVLIDDKLSPVTRHPSPVTLRLPISESLKTIQTVELIWDFLLQHNITRRGLLICIGGGVLTDLGGFAASTYKRGIDYINIPTTLLAMVDASTGGKTGFNYRGLKNCIGTFHEPVATFIDPSWLTTLPARDILNGYAEMLKTGLLDNGQWAMDNGQCLWNALLQYDLDEMNIEQLTPLIRRCIEVKSSIVAADPQETGLRKALNLGHTFGHALEEMQMVNGTSSNGTLPHGYAVLYGLIAELYLSVTKLGCPREPLQQLTQLMLHYYGRPVCKCSDRDKLIALMHQDKKSERAAEINCTLLSDLGQPLVNCLISQDEANQALDYLFSL